MNDIDLRSVCSHASQSLMWDGRQQTEPAEMHRYALAAASGVQVDAWFAENGNRRPAWLTARTAPQQPEKIAVAADRRFNLVDARDASGLDLDVEASDVRGVAHDLAPQQPDTPEHAARGR